MVSVIKRCHDEIGDDFTVNLKVAKKITVEDIRSRNCPYLDTINRALLDFDFEKLCSISLSHVNVYACLVCGKYFQGRGFKSHAYTHSLQFEHHVFLNLETQKFYCLPDNYQIIDQSLEDIVYVLNPTFTPIQINDIETSAQLSRAFDRSTYLPGIVGLNNIKANDYCNVVLQALAHVIPLRNFFLAEENYGQLKRHGGDQRYQLIQRFGELMRKLWNTRNFKAHVSPHEMLQAVVLCSKKEFQITQQSDCHEFLSWFLNYLDRALCAEKKSKNTCISEAFRGSMKVTSQKLTPIHMNQDEKEKLLLTEEYKEVVSETPFLYLTFDLPPPPLYPDEKRENIIPQVSLVHLLSKYNGTSAKEYKDAMVTKKFEIVKLPPYLILYFKRFTKTTFILEKNPTIVNFPIKGIDFGDVMTPEAKACHKSTVYDLMANIVHDGEPGKGSYRAHVLHKGSGKWFELQDLNVEEILPQMITLTESYVQIYELRKS